MAWRDQTHEIHVFVASDFETEENRVVTDSPYTVTLVAIDSQTNSLTSTLEVMVDDIANGTNITCLTFSEQNYTLICKISK